jgi:hypothetical protein
MEKQIYDDYKANLTLVDISKKYKLSHDKIKNIIAKEIEIELKKNKMTAGEFLEYYNEYNSHVPKIYEDKITELNDYLNIKRKKNKLLKQEIKICKEKIKFLEKYIENNCSE